MTTLLQLSDTHIVAEGELVSGRLDTNAPLERLIQRLQEVREQVGTVDAVLVTGDLSEDGSPESYDEFKRLLAPLDFPLYVIPGNHDARAPLRAAFAADGYLSEDGKLNWHRQIGDLHVIGLDTLVEGQGVGVLDDATLGFLDRTLKTIGGAPTMVALHHPPFKTGIVFMDAIGLQSTAAFGDVLRQHQGEILVVCGHLHCMIVSNIGGFPAISAPSPCSSFAFDTRKSARIGFHEQGDGCLIHRWAGTFQTVRIGPVGCAGPFPF